MKPNHFNKPFEIHSGELFTQNDVYGLFSGIVGDHNLELEQGNGGVLFATTGFGELSFKQFSERSWLRWEPKEVES